MTWAPMGQPAVGFFCHGVHNVQPLLVGQAPELAHAPGTAGPRGAQAADVADVALHPLPVKAVVWGKGRNQRGPLPLECLPSPLLGLMLAVSCHGLAPIVGMGIPSSLENSFSTSRSHHTAPLRLSIVVPRAPKRKTTVTYSSCPGQSTTMVKKTDQAIAKTTPPRTPATTTRIMMLIEASFSHVCGVENVSLISYVHLSPRLL